MHLRIYKINGTLIFDLGACPKCGAYHRPDIPCLIPDQQTKRWADNELWEAWLLQREEAKKHIHNVTLSVDETIKLLRKCKP